MFRHVPIELRATFCEQTHTLPTPAEVQAKQRETAIAEERLTLPVLEHKLHDVADFATQLALSIPADQYDLTDVIDAIDEARAALRAAISNGGEKPEPLFGRVFPNLSIRGE
jgi:hypothetical protein